MFHTMSRKAAKVLLVAVFALVHPCHAQTAGPNSPATPETDAAIPTSPVIVDGRTLFYVRGVSIYPAEKRADIIAERIRGIAADPKVSTESMEIEEVGQFSTIKAGDRIVMTLTSSDTPTEHVDRRILSQLYRDRAAQAIREYRFDRTTRALLHSALYAIGATLLAALLVLLTFRAMRSVNAMAERHVRTKLQIGGILSSGLVTEERVKASGTVFAQTLRNAIFLCVGFGYLDFVLEQFPWTRLAAGRLSSVLLDPLQRMGQAFVDALPGLIFVVILATVTRYIIKLARLFFVAIENGVIVFEGFDREWAMATFRIIRILALAFAAVVAYPYLPGSRSEAFKGVSLFLGVMFSLGSSSAIANIIAGYSLTYRRAFKLGDRIQIGEALGDVAEIRLQVTHLRTPKNEEVIIPNSTILNSQVINYSSMARQHGLILHTTVGIGYETPWRQVEAMLLEAAARTPELSRQPPPFVLQKSLDDFAVTYELNVYCDRPGEAAKFYAALHRRILDVFNEYGVQIMTPSYENDPEEPKLVPKANWYAAPAAPPDVTQSHLPEGSRTLSTST